MPNSSARRALTYRYTHTDGTDFIPWTADSGGNNANATLQGYDICTVHLHWKVMESNATVWPSLHVLTASNAIYLRLV